MKLEKLTLTNFKGIKYFEMTPHGKDSSVFGENATGKTSLTDAMAWLLYNQDSHGASLLPKPLDQTGEAAHGVSSDVEAIFYDEALDNKFTLKKSFFEKWTKRHGSAKKVFTGHTTKYSIDGVPNISEKEYKKRLAKIAPEQVFKLLTSTRYFSEDLRWQERRAILLDICGGISDKDIIKSNPALSRIVEILDGKSLEDQKKIITAQKAKLNKELTELPIRIDEVSKGQLDITGLDLPAIEKELSELSKALTQKNEEVIRIESGGEIAEKIKKQRGIESRLLEIENSINKARNKTESKQRKQALEAETVQRKKVAGLETAKEDEESARAKTLKVIKNREAVNETAEKEIIKLRGEWHFVNEKVFDEKATICPTCGQEYPSDQADKIRGKFHVDKAKALKKIDDNGRTVGAGIAARKDLNEIDQADISLYEEKIEDLTKQINEAKAQSESNKEPEKKKPLKNKEQEILEFDLAELKLNIEGLRADSDEAKEIVKSEIAALTGRQEGINLSKQTLETHKKGEARIKELSDSQKVVAGQYEKLESDLYVMDLFLKTKVGLLEGKVNSKFKLANFSLFETQVNGALNPVCEVTYDGIGWNSGLNSSMKIQVGLDIIDTLGEFYGLRLPVMIDNAESITSLPESDSQIIKLIVDKNYSELTVKIDK